MTQTTGAPCIEEQAPFDRGYVHVYTDDGKGKTTAAIGLAVRAAGAGLRVFIGQFVKSGKYSEVEALESFASQIVCRQYGRGDSISVSLMISIPRVGRFRVARFFRPRPSTPDLSGCVRCASSLTRRRPACMLTLMSM